MIFSRAKIEMEQDKNLPNKKHEKNESQLKKTAFGKWISSGMVRGMPAGLTF